MHPTVALTYAKPRLHKIFHYPFYAGWVVSERLGIKIGEVRGQWEPIVGMPKFERCIANLHELDDFKSLRSVHHYLLCGLLYVEENGRTYKMYGPTPTGKYQSYSYYITRTMIEDKKINIPCQVVEEQIPELAKSIMVDPDKKQAIQRLYQTEIKKITHGDQDESIANLTKGNYLV